MIAYRGHGIGNDQTSSKTTAVTESTTTYRGHGVADSQTVRETTAT